ncbi:MAG: UDP-N-acetylmuramoyl-L-alanyl-D-glutamate--2,6-diaminopimelate ligase, partial [Planctomycetaceae bacterium]|nr:UDP-N-acetylmuramoyl-L-alanyl-D-glutamate--2,6-diaminopimelate ligase [Planctomycetaceae bacterium]
EATTCSTDCTAGAVFAAVRGQRCNGSDFIDDAIARGAAAVLVDRPLPHVSVPQCVVPDVRQAYALLCEAIEGHPARHLSLTGVTGTNGKSTVTWLLRSILQEAGHQTGLLGTIEYDDGRTAEAATLTTPDARELAAWLQRMRVAGTTHAALELSSHALVQHRAAALQLSAAVLTNITQDHFDYHGTAAAYRQAKQQIFSCCRPHVPVTVNIDDSGCRQLLEEMKETSDRPIITCSLSGPADATATVEHCSLSGTTFTFHLPDGTGSRVKTTLVGEHNVSNCLLAAATAWHLGATAPQIAAGIERLVRIPGRLDRVECGSSGTVFVDYAHTDDALRRCVQFLKSLTPGRVFCVFGAGGDRDRTKRPLLASAASLADLAIVTTDNPRTESPQQIVTDLLQGFPAERQPARIDLNRARAIEWALEQARPGDSVLIAGKGHEAMQIIGTERIPFCDRNVAERWRRDGAHARIPAPKHSLPLPVRECA